VSSLVDNASFRAELAADDIDGYRRAAAVAIVSNLLDIVAAVLAVLVVRRTTNRQEARAARLAATAEALPPV
jgi:hypothetical protein